jgi:hypothetical protein
MPRIKTVVETIVRRRALFPRQAGDLPTPRSPRDDERHPDSWLKLPDTPAATEPTIGLLPSYPLDDNSDPF